jgi:hypothetical protein
MTEDGSYIKYKLQEGEKEINIHKLFYKLKENQLQTGCLF